MNLRWDSLDINFEKCGLLKHFCILSAIKTNRHRFHVETRMLK